MGRATRLTLLVAALGPWSPGANAAGQEGTTASGRVLDAEGRPVAGADVWLTGHRRLGILGVSVLAAGRTDAEGRFRVEVPPLEDPQLQGLSLGLWADRPEAGLAGYGFARGDAPQDQTLTLDDADTTLHVVGPDDAPVAGTEIAPFQIRVPGVDHALTLPEELLTRHAVEVDESGRATLRGIAAPVLQVARVDSERLGRILVTPTIETDGDADGDATLTLIPAGSLAGRVVADDPAAVRGLDVVVYTRPDDPARGMVNGQARATTDVEGRFAVPALAGGKLSISVQIPEGSPLVARPPTDAVVEAGRATEVEVRLLDLGKTRTVSGRVLDGRGEPVAGATVFQTGDAPGRTEVRTDAQGGFTLNGVAPGPAFVFARGDGYRFAGSPVGPDQQEVGLTLTRSDEPPTAAMQTRPPALAHDEEVALARRLLDPYAERALKEGDEGSKVQVLEALARLDPARVLEQADAGTLGHPFLAGLMRMRVAEALIGDSPEEAVAVVESIDDAGARAMGLLQLLRALPDDQRARKAELLDRAALASRAVEMPWLRAISVAQVGEGWLDLGERPRAEGLLREAQDLAETLPTAGHDGFAHGAVAEELAQVDLDAALELAAGLDDTYAHDRHHGNIAHELAAIDPAAAERVLAMVGKHEPRQRDHFAMRVVYRMAPVDLDRARRVAASMDQDELRGYAQGMMALSLAEDGQDEAARSMLQDAFATLERAAETGWEGRQGMRSTYLPAPIAGGLLPVVEAVDPGLVPEFLWRSLALRLPVPADDARAMAAASADTQLALMLARFDRDLARALLEPILDPDAPTAARHTGRSTFEVAAAVADPSWAADLVEAMPEDPGPRHFPSKDAARLAVANALARGGERRWRYLQQQYLHLWIPDIEDIAPGL